MQYRSIKQIYKRINPDTEIDAFITKQFRLRKLNKPNRAQ
jgi:hypothetical protein